MENLKFQRLYNIRPRPDTFKAIFHDLMQIKNELDIRDQQYIEGSLVVLLQFTRPLEGNEMSIQSFNYKSVDNLKSVLRSTRETLIFIKSLDTRHYSNNVIDSLFKLSTSLSLFLNWETDNQIDYLV